MERPERPRRHKTIVQRQTPRPTVRTRPSPSFPYEFEVYESDSDTDMEVDVSHQPQTQLHRSMANFEERPINRLRPPVLTTASQHLLNRSSSHAQGLNSRSELFRSRRDSRYPYPITLLIGRSALNVTHRPVAETSTGLFSRTQNKRFRNHTVGPFTSRPGQSGVPMAIFTPPTAHTAIPQLPPGPIALSPSTTTQGGPIPIVNLFKPDVNPPLNNGSTSEAGSMESPFSRSLQGAAVSSNPTRSRILEEIDELCYVPVRPRLTPRRRLHNIRSRDIGLNCTSCSNNDSTNTNNPFIVRESPLSPPLVDTGINVNNEETGQPHRYTSSIFDMYTARGDDRTQMSDDAEETPTVMCQIMMNSTDTELRPADNNMQQDGHPSSLPMFSRMERIPTVVNVQQPIDMSPFAQPESPILCEPHTPNTSPPLSPISPESNNPSSPFDVVPTSPLTSPPSSPVANNDHVLNETANSSVSVQLEFYETTSEDETSIEETNHINEIIVLDTPERPTPPERQTPPERPTSTELPIHPRDQIVTVVSSLSSDRSDQVDRSALPSTTNTPSTALTPILGRKSKITNTPSTALPPFPGRKSKVEKVNASDTLKELNHNLVSLLECPVCLDFMVPPILQCSKGHLVCAACRPKLTVCPTCRSRFAERNLAMEKVAEKLMYPCKNLVTGCNVTLKLKDKTKHEQNCGFRHFDCIVRSCEWKGYKPELIVHLSNEHEDKLLIGNEKDIMVSYTAERESWIFYTFDEIFVLTVVADHINKKLLSCVQIIGSPEKAPQFAYALKFERGGPYMSMQFWHETHTDEFKAVSIFYANKGIIMDVNDVRRYAVRPNHRRVSVKVTIKRLYE